MKYPISKIEWIDKEAREATVEIEVGDFTVKCFSYPCNFKKGDTNYSIYAIIDEAFQIHIEKVSTEANACKMIARNGQYSYLIIGKAISTRPLILNINNFVVETDVLINDPTFKDANVCISVDRLDII